MTAPGDRLRPSRPVPFNSRHLPGGWRPTRAAHRLDGPLPRRGRYRRQPAPGPLAHRPARAGRSRPAVSGGRASPGPDQYTFQRFGVGTPPHRMLETLGRFGALQADRPCASDRERGRKPIRPSPQTAVAVSPTRPSSSPRSPTPRRAAASRKHLAGLAAMIGAGLPLHSVALEASGEYDTHADEAVSRARSDSPRSHRSLSSASRGARRR